MRHLFYFLFFISSYLAADAINTEELFSDNYQGYVYNQNDIYWYQEKSYRVMSYKSPNLDSVSIEVELNPICIEGGGGDCGMGVLYKKLIQDAKGNHFYLVKDKNQQDVWIHSNDWEARDFDKRMIDFNGMDLILSDSFDTTDSSIKNAVPSLENERNKKIKEILQPFSSKLGGIRIEVPGDTKALQVKDSHLQPEGQFLDYLLSTESYYFQKDTNSYVIETTIFKRQGRYMLVELNSMPGLTVRDYECAGLDSNYFWLDTKGLDVEFIEAETSYSPVNFLLDEFSRSYSVKEIKTFNGNAYALIQEHLSVLNPFVVPDENRAKRNDYIIPYKWIKIRDDKGRLRFWFANYSC